MAKQNIRCSASQVNWNAAHLVRGKKKKQGRRRWIPRSHWHPSKIWHALNPKTEKRLDDQKKTWRRSMEQQMKALGWSWGPDRKDGCRHNFQMYKRGHQRHKNNCTKNRSTQTNRNWSHQVVLTAAVCRAPSWWWRTLQPRSRTVVSSGPSPARPSSGRLSPSPALPTPGPSPTCPLPSKWSTYYIRDVVCIIQAVQHTYVKKRRGGGTSTQNIKNTRIKVGKHKEKVGKNRWQFGFFYIREGLTFMQFEFAAFFNFVPFEFAIKTHTQKYK